MNSTIVIETNSKTENSIKTLFIKKTIEQIRLVFLSKRTCVQLKNITHFLLLKAQPISIINAVLHYK